MREREALPYVRARLDFVCGLSPFLGLIETKHEDHIHDVAWDYYARKIATASSDRTVKVFAVDGDQSTLCATLTGHDGPAFPRAVSQSGVRAWCGGLSS